MGTVLDRSDLREQTDLLKQQGKRVVTTNGCFDILHVGHVRYLKEAKTFGDVLVIGVNSDSSVRRLKGNMRPLVPQADRAELLASLGCVDFVSIFDEDTPIEFIKSVRPDVHVKGGDYTPEVLAETPVVEKLGGRLQIIELVPDKSTSRLVERIRQWTAE